MYSNEIIIQNKIYTPEQIILKWNYHRQSEIFKTDSQHRFSGQRKLKNLNTNWGFSINRKYVSWMRYRRRVILQILLHLSYEIVSSNCWRIIVLMWDITTQFHGIFTIICGKILSVGETNDAKTPNKSYFIAIQAHLERVHGSIF